MFNLFSVLYWLASTFITYYREAVLSNTSVPDETVVRSHGVRWLSHHAEGDWYGRSWIETFFRFPMFSNSHCDSDEAFLGLHGARLSHLRLSATILVAVWVKMQDPHGLKLPRAFHVAGPPRLGQTR